MNPDDRDAFDRFAARLSAVEAVVKDPPPVRRAPMRPRAPRIARGALGLAGLLGTLVLAAVGLVIFTPLGIIPDAIVPLYAGGAALGAVAVLLVPTGLPGRLFRF